MLTQAAYGFQGGGPNPGQSRSTRFGCSRLPGNADFSVLFFSGHGSFQQTKCSKESFLRYKTTKERSWSNSCLQCPHLFQILYESFSGDCGTRGGEGERGGSDSWSRAGTSSWQGVCARSRSFRHSDTRVCHPDIPPTVSQCISILDTQTICIGWYLCTHMNVYKHRQT
jgi:hypothetical protein